MTVADEPDQATYNVVVNQEEQYSIWPTDRENPAGWTDVGLVGSRQECLAHIDEIWTDQRPLSLRRAMAEADRSEVTDVPPETQEAASRAIEDHGTRLVARLCEGQHPVEAVLYRDPSARALKAAIDEGYVFVRFTATQGGTELGFRLDRACVDVSRADFENATGCVHLEGELTLDSCRVRSIADIDLETLSGTGHLVLVEEGRSS